MWRGGEARAERRHQIEGLGPSEVTCSDDGNALIARKLQFLQILGVLGTAARVTIVYFQRYTYIKTSLTAPCGTRARCDRRKR